MRLKMLLLSSLSAGLCFHASIAPAQDAGGTRAQNNTDFADIIVTARKREESILKVPVTEDVITSAQLQQSEINDLDHVVARIPGLGIGQQVATIGAAVSIRGVGTTTLDAGVDQSVALNIDGLPLSQGLAFKSGLFDLAQAEVLKGPQSLYYGKNSTAGVIALHSADPGSTFEMTSRTGYEAEGQELRNEFIVSGPVTDTLGLRLAAMYSDYKGFYYNDAVATPAWGGVTPSDDRIGGQTSFIVRGTAVWKPTSNFDVRLKVNHDSDQGPGPAAQLISCPNGTGPVTTPPVNFITGDCRLDRNAPVTDLNPQAFPGVWNNGRQLYLQQQDFGTLEAHYRPAGTLTLTSLTGYYNVASRALFNGTVSGDATSLSSDNDFHRHDLTEEIRLESDYSTPLNFMAGAFYQDSQVSNFIRLKTDTFLNALFDAPFPPSLYNGNSTMNIHAYSGFGQLRWKALSQVEVSAGARYTDEKRDDVVDSYALTADYANGAATFLPLATPAIESKTWSPEATVTWTPTDTTTVYGSAKRGYKSGTFSISRIFTGPGAEASVGDEKVEGGEIGLKAKVLERRMLVNLAVYDYFYKGLQVGTDSQPCLTCAPENLTLNAGAARVYGVDSDFEYRPSLVDGLSVRGAVNYNHARFVQLNHVPCSGGQTVAEGCNELIGGTLPAQNLSGIPLVRAPDWQLTTGVEYERPLSDKYAIEVGADAQYSTRYLTTITDRRDSDEPGYAKFNANLTLKGPDDRWELAFIGNNLTDKLTFGNSNVSNYQGGALYGSGAKDEVIAYVDRGRELWARLTMKF